MPQPLPIPPTTAHIAQRLRGSWKKGRLSFLANPCKAPAMPSSVKPETVVVEQLVFDDLVAVGVQQRRAVFGLAIDYFARPHAGRAFRCAARTTIHALAARLYPRIHLGASIWRCPGWIGIVWNKGFYSETMLAKNGLAGHARRPRPRPRCVGRLPSDLLGGEDADTQPLRTKAPSACSGTTYPAAARPLFRCSRA